MKMAATARMGSVAQLVDSSRQGQKRPEVLRIDPNWTIEASMRVNIFKKPQYAAHYFGGTRKAGLPQR